VLAPLRQDKEKASDVQPEGDGAVLAHEESNALEQPNQEPSNVSAGKVLGGHSSDLHETEVILEGDGLKIGSHQSDVVLEVGAAILFFLKKNLKFKQVSSVFMLLMKLVQ
jgi:hypothetical protein